MKRQIKKILSLLIILLVFTNPLHIYAKDKDNDMDYGEVFEAIMDTIDEYYLYDNVTKEQLFENAIEGMFNVLDPYSIFMNKERMKIFNDVVNSTYVGIGVELNATDEGITIVYVFDGSPAQEEGILVGDIIQAVDDNDVSDLTVYDVLEALLGEEGTNVKVTVTRDNEQYSFDLTRTKIEIPSVNYLNILEVYDGLDEKISKKIGYISISSFTETVDKEFEEHIKQAQEDGVEYLVLDLRNNGGGYVVQTANIGKMIVPEGKIVSFINKNGQGETYYSDLKNPPFKIVALVNENTASAAEILASAIQDSGVGVLVGETTYGKGVSQGVFEIEDGYGMKLTMEEYFTRNDHSVNGVGVTPDYLVEIPYLIDTGYEIKFKLNDEHEEVYYIEKALLFLGYDVDEPDTIFDLKTFEAVKSFQKDTGLYPYGVCDITTQNKLNEKLQETIEEKDIQLEKAVNVILEGI